MAARMVSHRSFTILFFGLISALVLLITAKRLDQATWDAGSFTASGHYRHGHADDDVASTVNTTVTHVVTITTAVAAETPVSPPTPTEPLHPAGNGAQSTLPQATRDPICDGFPDTSNILLVMKTGATESFDRLPVQIMTALKCLPDFLLFSDLDQHIGGYHVRDSLETVLEEAKEDNPDFDLYRLQQQCAVDQDNCVKMMDGAGTAGWNLDKYKNIHMAEKSYRMRPNYDWYVFVDADTYVSWPNLVYSLNKLDPTEEKYLGVVTIIGHMIFGHGGSGYVVSQAAMKNFVGKNPGIANKYDADIKYSCCGDFMFAVALNDTIGLLVEGFWPISNGEKPFTASYGSQHWCHPVGMMHHMNSEEISMFWEYERKRYRSNQTPLVYREVFEDLILPRLQPSRDNWDNFADDWFVIDFNRTDYHWEEWRVGRSTREEYKTETEKKAHENWQNCQAACYEHSECFQYFWHNEVCAMHRSFRLGTPRPTSEDETLRHVSGWNVDKINGWLAENGDCAGRVDWPDLVRIAIEGAQQPAEGILPVHEEEVINESEQTIGFEQASTELGDPADKDPSQEVDPLFSGSKMPNLVEQGTDEEDAAGWPWNGEI